MADGFIDVSTLVGIWACRLLIGVEELRVQWRTMHKVCIPILEVVLCVIAESCLVSVSYCLSATLALALALAVPWMPGGSGCHWITSTVQLEELNSFQMPRAGD